MNQHLLRLDPASGLPIYVQLVEQIKHAVEICALRPGDQLPSVRALAQELVVSPNTVVKAYLELEVAGVIELRQGAGAYVLDAERHPRAAGKLLTAKAEVHNLVEKLRGRGLLEDEIRRIFEAELLNTGELDTRKGRHK
ncbi:MAG: GntR family transcriptional regulator [Paludibaculum sp.]